MIVKIWYILFVFVILIIGLVILFSYIRSKEPFKAAIASLLSSLTVLFGGLGLPEIKAEMVLKADLSKDVLFDIRRLEVVSGTPQPLWLTACIAISLLLAVYGLYLLLDNKDKRKYPKEKDGG